MTKYPCYRGNLIISLENGLERKDVSCKGLER